MKINFKREAACPPAAVVEASVAGEAVGPWEAHLTTCSNCGAYRAALLEAQRAFLAQRPPELFVRQVTRRATTSAPSRWALWSAAAATLGILIMIPKIILKNGAEVREKGGTAFHVIIKHGDGVPAVAASDAAVSAGDRLRFSFRAPADGAVAVFEIDGTGQVTPFVPYREGLAVAVRAGETVLPGSVVLDAAPGPEWLVAVFEPAPFEVAPMAGRLRAPAPGLPLELDCGHCRVESIRFRKVP